MSHNKTLAAQLYGELKQFFPRTRSSTSSRTTTTTSRRRTSRDGHVHREGLVDQRGHRAAAAAGDLVADGARGRDHRRVRLVHLRPGRPAEYRELMLTLEVGQQIERREILQALVASSTRATTPLRARHLPRARRHGRGLPGLRGAGGPHRAVGRRDRADHALRPADRRHHRALQRTAIYPATHFVTQRSTIERAVGRIRAELEERLLELRGERASCWRRSGWSSARTSTSR
jgi:excinuclease ABC subunit B